MILKATYNYGKEPLEQSRADTYFFFRFLLLTDNFKHHYFGTISKLNPIKVPILIKLWIPDINTNCLCERTG